MLEPPRGGEGREFPAEALVPFGLPEPWRGFSIVVAPKLMRRPKGVFGGFLAYSSSSTAFSSMASELVVEMLPRRTLNGDVVGFCAPRPSVVTDNRRRWSRAETDVMDSLPLPLLADTELLRWKRLAKAAVVTEPLRPMPFEFESPDIVTIELYDRLD